MSGTTEIYLVRGDENLRDGELEYSDSIDCREAAQADAAARCNRDRTIRKVAYYRVNEEGDFRVMLVYENPNPAFRRQAPPRRLQADPALRPRSAKTANARKPKLFDRLLDALRE